MPFSRWRFPSLGVKSKNDQASDLPIFIGSFNDLTGLRRLIRWLRRSGHSRIFVIDNASTFPALLTYYRRIEGRGVRVLRLGDNVGPQALWQSDILNRVGVSGPFIYTDSDVVPAGCCPVDAVGFLLTLLQNNPSAKKVGLGLRLDNIPMTYRHRDSVLLWERQFWRWPAVPGAMFAPVDTTFAIYPAGAGHDQEATNLRTTWPYLADHLGWQVNSARLNREQRHYQQTARSDITSWGKEQLRADFALGLPNVRTPALIRLTGLRTSLIQTWPGWTDMSMDGEAMSGLATGTVDGFYADEDFGSVADRLGLLQELHRVAKPNARLVLRQRGSAALRVARDWLLAGQPAHAGSEATYAGDWAVSSIHLLPAADAALLMHLFAVKPARARVASLEVWPEPMIAPSALNPTPQFDVVPA